MPFYTRSTYTIPSPSGSGTVKNCTTSNFISTLNAAVAGDVLVLADGDYGQVQWTNRSFPANTPVTIVAQNKHGAYFRNAGVGYAMFLGNCHGLHFYGIRFNGGTWNVIIGGSGNVDGSWDIGPLSGPCSNLTFTHCWFNHSNNEANVQVMNGRRDSSSFYLREQCTRDIAFIDCDIQGGREGLYLGKDMPEDGYTYNGGPHWIYGITVRGCKIWGMKAEPIDAKSCWETVVEDCEITDCHSDEYAALIPVHYPVGYATTVPPYGLQYIPSYHNSRLVFTLRRCRVYGNRFNNLGGGNSNGIGLYVRNCVVENNLFFDLDAAGVYGADRSYLDGDFPCVIRHNTFWNNGQRSGSADITLTSSNIGVRNYYVVSNNAGSVSGIRTGDVSVGNVTPTVADFVGPTTGTCDAGGGAGSGLYPPANWSRTGTVTAPAGTSTDVYGNARNFAAGGSEPGAFEIGGGGGEPPPPDPGGTQTPTLVASGGEKSATVSFPANVQIGDCLVVYAAGSVHTQNGALPASISGSGWTKHVDAIGGASFPYGPHHALFTKTATVGGAQSYTLTFPGDAGAHHAWMVWRNIDPADPIDAAGVGELAYKPSGQAPVGPSVTTVTANAVVLTWVVDESLSAIPGPPAGFTAAAGSFLGYRGIWHAYDVRESPGATGALTWANPFTTNANHGVATIALTPLGNNVTVSPSGFADTAAFGTPSVSNSATVSPSGVADGQTFGAPTVTATVTVSPAAVQNVAGFGVPLLTLSGGVQSPVVYGIAPTVVFGTTEAWLGEPQTVLVSDLENQVRFGEPEVFRNYSMTWLAWVARGIDSGH